jgi:hypothetical protein
MTVESDMIPISGKLAGDIITLLGQWRSDSGTHPTLRHRIDALCKTLGDACQIAGEHRSAFEMMASELLEASGRATGRQLSTVATWANVKAAVEALEHTCPVLTTIPGNLLTLPRAPERETAKAIEAEAARALADMPGPLDLNIWVDGRFIETRNGWVVPEMGTEIDVDSCIATIRRIVWAAPHTWAIYAEQSRCRPGVAL